MEQQRIRKERQADFDLQQALEKQYLKVQTVQDGGPAEPPEASQKVSR
jgi:protein PET117